MRNQRTLVHIAVGAMIGGLCSLVMFQAGRSTSIPAIPEIATPITLSGLPTVDHTGSTINALDTVDEPIIIIDFWATWCGPCLAELEDLANLNLDKSIAVIGVAIDDLEDEHDPTAVFALMDRRGLTLGYPSYAKGPQTFDPFQDLLPPDGPRSIPTKIVLDAERKTRFLLVGAQNTETYAFIKLRLLDDTDRPS